ncbi:MAG TPA: PhzF family phenazine biosynthesis protein [Blastocatellia bacterium]|nr:PhzF family phenazine biosynthesis protein [Blastocatellia bacterium]
MPNYKFIQCDVFTDRIFAGNPLAVFPDGEGIDDATMQKIAREMNLSETVFVLPPTDPSKALKRLRIFTPGAELPMAGHPVVGTWIVLARRGVVAPPESGNGTVRVFQELNLGILPVDIEFERGSPVKVVMTQATPTIGEPLDEVEAASQALNLSPEEIGDDVLPILIASTGLPYLIVPVRSRSALSRVVINNSALTALLKRVGTDAVYIVTRDTYSPDAFVSTRMFTDESIGIGEDPATGSAAGPLAAVLTHYGLAPMQDSVAHFIIEQGVDMGRPSRIEVDVEVEDKKLKSVRIGGGAVFVLKGEIEL